MNYLTPSSRGTLTERSFPLCDAPVWSLPRRFTAATNDCYSIIRFRWYNTKIICRHRSVAQWKQALKDNVMIAQKAVSSHIKRVHFTLQNTMSHAARVACLNKTVSVGDTAVSLHTPVPTMFLGRSGGRWYSLLLKTQSVKSWPNFHFWGGDPHQNFHFWGGGGGG